MSETLPAKPSRQRAPTSHDPIEIAMEAEAAGAEPVGVAHEVLRKQSALIGWQIASERAGFALKVLTGLAGLAVAAALALMVWQASQARGLLVEPFSVPPEMAARGLTGEVVASHVLDQLARMQVESNAYRKASSYSNDWGNDIKVAIPTTGVNLGELQAALRRWLGHETRISGEIYRTPTGVALAARTGGAAAFVAEGAESDLDGLATQIAAAIYRSTQPYRYGRLLSTHGDTAGPRRCSASWRPTGPTITSGPGVTGSGPGSWAGKAIRRRRSVSPTRPCA